MLTTGAAPPAPFLADSPRSAEAGPVEPVGSDVATTVRVVEADVDGMVRPRAREIPVTSDHHDTIFGKQISGIRDVPREARRLLEAVSRASEVVGVRFAAFTSRGASREFALVLSRPTGGVGSIEGRLTGPAKIGGSQRIRIRVTPGRETVTYLVLERLLSGELA